MLEVVVAVLARLLVEALAAGVGWLLHFPADLARRVADPDGPR